MGESWYSSRDKGRPPPRYWLEFQVCSDGVIVEGGRHCESDCNGLSDGTTERPGPDRPTQFPRFQELPAELRLKIWELLVTPRIVVVACMSSQNEEQKRAQLALRPRRPATPVLLHICHESRMLALRYWELTFSWKISSSLCDGDDRPMTVQHGQQVGERRFQQSLRRAESPPRVWFNFAFDTLLLLGELEPFDMNGFASPSVYFLRKADTARVRHVACAFEELRYGACPDEQIFGCLFSIVDRFPLAQRLLITSTDRDLETYGSVLPALGRRGSGAPAGTDSNGQMLASETNIVQRIWDGWLMGRSVVTLALEKRQILMVREDGLADFLESSG
jgi:hypothetical protein